MKSLIHLAIVLSSLSGCEPAREPPRLELPLVVDASGVAPVVTDLGYAMVLTEARAALRDFTFATPGEAHARGAWFGIVSIARAHPGHYEGGATTGELRGEFVVDFMDEGREIGLVTLLVASYASASFTFARAGSDSGLADGDPLLGHTALMRGTASRDGETVEFTVALDAPDGRELIGAPFEMEVTERTRALLGFRLLTFDPRGEKSLFDGVDFFALDQDGDGLVSIEPGSILEPELSAYNRLRNTFLTHDHFDVRPTFTAE